LVASRTNVNVERQCRAADADALSLALQKSAQAPELSRTASEYLVEQKRRVQLQIAAIRQLSDQFKEKTR